MIERGRDAPPAFYDRPEIEPHLQLFWDAFWELSTERQLGNAIGPIPASRIREYLRDELDLHGNEYDRARAIVRRADDAWIAMLNRRKDDAPDMTDAAKMTDAEGVKRVMRRLGKAKPGKRT
jgi:hypothetical protein